MRPFLFFGLPSVNAWSVLRAYDKEMIKRIACQYAIAITSVIGTNFEPIKIQIPKDLQKIELIITCSLCIVKILYTLLHV